MCFHSSKRLFNLEIMVSAMSMSLFQTSQGFSAWVFLLTMTSTYKHKFLFSFRISAPADSGSCCCPPYSAAMCCAILENPPPTPPPFRFLCRWCLLLFPFPQAAPEHFLMAARVPKQPSRTVLVTLAFTPVTAVTPRHSPLSAAWHEECNSKGGN